MSFNYSPKVVKDGLVFCLDAANMKSYPASGNSWFDIGTSNNTCTLQNTPTFSSTNNGIITFDGVNEYGITSNFYDFSLTNQLVASVWCKSNVSTWNDYGFILSKRDQFIIHPTISSKEVVVYVNTTTVGWESIFYTPTVSITDFNNYVLSYNSGILKIYFNGELKATNTNVGTTLSSSTSPLYVGRDSSLNRYLNGSISNVLIYNKILTDAQVLQNYNAHKTRFNLS